MHDQSTPRRVEGEKIATKNDDDDDAGASILFHMYASKENKRKAFQKPTNRRIYSNFPFLSLLSPLSLCTPFFGVSHSHIPLSFLISKRAHANVLCTENEVALCRQPLVSQSISLAHINPSLPNFSFFLSLLFNLPIPTLLNATPLHSSTHPPLAKHQAKVRNHVPSFPPLLDALPSTKFFIKGRNLESDNTPPPARPYAISILSHSPSLFT